MPRCLPVFLTALLLCVPGVTIAAAQQSMDNAAVLKLKSAGLSDDLIAQTVAASPGHFDTGVDSMIALKKAGVSDKVIGAMVSKNANPNGTPATAASATTAPVDEVGVYYKDKSGAWQPVLPEIVNFKTGGVLKSMATAGIVKGDLNGHIKGGTAKLTLNSPVSILLYVPEGTAPTEYQLLKLHATSDYREFRSVTGGVVHVESGAGKDQLEFQYTKIAPRSYQVTLPPGTVVGEYGVLPPGSNASTNAASAGKIYTFHLVE